MRISGLVGSRHRSSAQFPCRLASCACADRPARGAAGRRPGVLVRGCAVATRVHWLLVARPTSLRYTTTRALLRNEKHEGCRLWPRALACGCSRAGVLIEFAIVAVAAVTFLAVVAVLAAVTFLAVVAVIAVIAVNAFAV